MKNHLLAISFAFTLIPFYNADHGEPAALIKESSHEIYTASSTINAAVLYDEMELDKMGLSKSAFQYAYKGYQNLVEKGEIRNAELLAITDFTQSSSKKRFYIIDLEHNKVLINTYVAHGRGSGGEYANRFSNKANSHQSSLGFYITGNTYFGQHGLSLKLNGIEPGINSLASKRNIVIHGASYIGDDYGAKSKCMGRSYGCPAVPKNECQKIVALLSGGTCLFIYHPSQKYLQQSKILND